MTTNNPTLLPKYAPYMWSTENNENGYHTQTIYKFPNNFGASVIFHKGSYGYEQGLMELAVLIFTDNHPSGAITYDTTITDDVVGYLTSDKVEALLEEIKNYNTQENTDV